MSESLPEEEPSVLISANTLRHLVEVAQANPATVDRCAACQHAIEEAESALERYK